MNGSRMRLGKKSKSFWKQTKQTHNNPKLTGHSKGSPEREFIAIQAYLKKIETFQTNKCCLRKTRLGTKYKMDWKGKCGMFRQLET